MNRPQWLTIELIRRVNGGPAAARNTGLERVPADIEYVAFLDSDDRWAPDHLARSAQALSRGFGFYFSDLMHLDQVVSAFVRTGRLDPSQHDPLQGVEGLFGFRGDMFDQIIRGNLIGTSTVVFDRRRFPDIRFREEYYSAGEDYLCWMEFARSGAQFVFSTRCEAIYGRGVNVYSGAQWGTVQHLDRVHNEYKYRCATLRLYPVTAEQAAHLRGSISRLREEFALDILHLLRRGQLPPWRIVRKQMLLDRWTLLQPLAVAGRRLMWRRRP